MDEIATLRMQIAETEAARKPLDELTADALHELDGWIDQARRAPGHWPLPVATFSPAALRAVLLGSFALIAPAETKKMITASITESEKSFQGLRLNAKQKAQRLSKLNDEMVVLQAAAELARRRQEASEPETVLSRSGFDPAIWSQTTAELTEIAGAR